MEPKTNFFRVSHATVECEDFKTLAPIVQVFYFYLCKLRNRYQRGQKTYFTRSDNQLVKDTGLSRSSIRKARQILKDKRFIYFKGSKGKRTRYQIFEPDVTAKMVMEYQQQKKRYLRRVK